MLAGLTVLLGLVPNLASNLVSAAADSLVPEVGHVHLAVWHGSTPCSHSRPLTVLLGCGVVVAGPVVAGAAAVPPHLVDGDLVYLGTIRGLNRLADRTTGVSQSGRCRCTPP